MRFQHGQFCGILLVFSLLIVCFMASIDPALVKAGGSVSIGWPNQGTINSALAANLLWSTDMDSVTGYGTIYSGGMDNPLSGCGRTNIDATKNGGSGYTRWWVEGLSDGNPNEPLRPTTDWQGNTIDSTHRCLGQGVYDHNRDEIYFQDVAWVPSTTRRYYYLEAWRYLPVGWENTINVGDWICFFAYKEGPSTSWAVHIGFDKVGSGNTFNVNLFYSNNAGFGIPAATAIRYTIPIGQWFKIGLWIDRGDAGVANAHAKAWISTDNFNPATDTPLLTTNKAFTMVQSASYMKLGCHLYMTYAGHTTKVWTDDLKIYDGIP